MPKLRMPDPPPDWDEYVRSVSAWVNQRSEELGAGLCFAPWGREDKMLGLSVYRSSGSTSISREESAVVDLIDEELQAAGHKPIFSMQLLRDPE